MNTIELTENIEDFYFIGIFKTIKSKFFENRY